MSVGWWNGIFNLSERKLWWRHKQALEEPCKRNASKLFPLHLGVLCCVVLHSLDWAINYRLTWEMSVSCALKMFPAFQLDTQPNEQKTESDCGFWSSIYLTTYLFIRFLLHIKISCFCNILVNKNTSTPNVEVYAFVCVCVNVFACCFCLRFDVDRMQFSLILQYPAVVSFEFAIAYISKAYRTVVRMFWN